jgi:hypothetical protein
MSVLKVNSIVDANSGNTAQINGMTPTAQSLQGFRNRIINGDMVIAQRGTAAVTINSGAHTYTVDRWSGFGQTSDGVFTVQQSAVAPVGFVNSLLATVTTADASIGASQFYGLRQAIEGFNMADLGWGTANAQPVTLGFWVRSSLTGAFSGAVTNGSFNRSYPFSFTVNAANTYEYKTITIAGDTSGTWATNNTAGIFLYFDLGSGSSNKGTAGVWAASGLVGVTGSVNLIATSGATFYITGVQLEAGSVATPFERRPFGTELALCLRYFWRWDSTESNFTFYALGRGVNTTVIQTVLSHPVIMRASPTMTFAGNFQFANGNAVSSVTAATPTRFNTGANWVSTSVISTSCYVIEAANTSAASVSASAEL